MIWTSFLPTPVRQQRPSSKFWNGDELMARRPSPQKKSPSAHGRGFLLSGISCLRCAVGLVFQLFRLEVGDQRINQRLEFAVHHFLQLVDG